MNPSSADLISLRFVTGIAGVMRFAYIWMDA